MARLKEILARIPVLSWIVSVSSRAKIPGFEGMTLYDLWETYSVGILEGAFTLRASAISYSFFMAIFPFILFMLNLIPFVPVENFQTDFLDFVNGLLPAQAAGSFDYIFKEIALQENTGLLTIAFITSLFFMSNGINAVFNGFERSYHTSFNRGMLRQYLIAVAVSLLLSLFLLLSIVVFGIVEYWIGMLRAQEFMPDASSQIGLKLLRYASVIVMLYLFVSTLYYTGTKEGRENSFFSAGSLMTTILILLSSYLYGIYIDNFASYNEIYGSIGALLILMIYIWLTANVLLLGYELNASIRSLKARNLDK